MSKLTDAVARLGVAVRRFLGSHHGHTGRTIIGKR